MNKYLQNKIFVFSILIFSMLIIITTVMIYNYIINIKAAEKIEIGFSNLTIDNLKKIKIYFKSPKRGLYIIPRNLEDKWKLENRFVGRIYICYENKDIINNNPEIYIKIGEKIFNYNKNTFIEKWKEVKIDIDNNSYSFESPKDMYSKKSNLKLLSQIINWQGDERVLLKSLLKSFFIILIIFFILFSYSYFHKNHNKIFNKMKNDYIIIPVITIAAIIIKIFSLEIIEISGDSVWSWFNVKSFIQGLGFLRWDHHTTRMSKIIPLAIIQTLFGSNSINYYILSLIFSVISILMIYKIGCQIHNEKLGLLSAFLFLFMPELTRASSQLIPSIYSICYVTISIFFLFKYIKINNKLYLILSSLFLFISYLSEITNLFFIPGIIVALLINKKQKMKNHIFDILIYGFILLFLFFAETLIYYNLTGNILGRIGIIKSNHLHNIHFQLNNIWQIFDRYLKLSGIWFIVFFSNLFISIIMLFSKHHNKIKGIISITFSFFLIMVFTISKIKPLMMSLKFNTRYLDVCLPFMFLIISYFLIVFLKEYFVKLNDLITKKNLQFDINILQNIIVITIIVLYIYFNYSFLNFKFKNNSFIMTNKYEKIINNAYENKIPILIFDNESYKKEKFYNTINYAFLYKKYWLKENHINFSNLHEIYFESKSFSFMLNDDEEKSNEIIKKYAENNKKVFIMRSEQYDKKEFILEEYNFKTILDHYDYFSN